MNFDEEIIVLQKVLILLLVIFLAGSIVQSSFGARQRRKAQPKTTAISEDDRSWAGLVWIVPGALGVGAMAVGLKNAKRTHLD